jgi:hypothetical protein
MAQLNVQVGSYWVLLQKAGGPADSIIEVCSIEHNWVLADVYGLANGSPVKHSECKYPIHRFDSEDPLGFNQQVPTLADGMLLLKDSWQ